MKKLRSLCLLIFCLATIVSNGQMFEGKITYDITISFDSTYDYQSYQQAKYGDTQVMYIDTNGNMRREYPNSGELGVEYVLYLQSTNKVYYKTRYSDTLLMSDVALANSQFLESRALPAQPVLGKSCEGVMIGAMAVDNKAGIAFPWTMDCYYSTDYPLNPERFKDYKAGLWNKYAEEAKCIYLKMVFNEGIIHRTFLATSVEEESTIGKFELPSLPIKSIDDL